MSLQHWLLYLTVILAVIVPPGPTALLCMNHGAHHGRSRSMATVLGGASAALSLMLLSALGMGALVSASDLAFQLLTWAGAAYLVYLGITTWRAPAPNLRAVARATLATSSEHGLRRLFGTGYRVGVSNPKDLLFFSALFPQFLNPAAPLPPQLGVLALTWIVVESGVMFGYAAFGKVLMFQLARHGYVQWFNRLAGAAFVAAGSALAAVRAGAVA
jgi:homoserine/homoserine lactone efflux protein